MLGLLGLLAGPARADLLATHPHRDGPVRLMSEPCGAQDLHAGQLARQTVGGRERQGCWGVEGTGHPVVTWRDGSELVLDAPPVKPAPSRAAERSDFARPAWCPEARFPHERLVCADAELAARDLHLASLWSPYRRTLSAGAVAWHKSDYFRRLKVCGANKPCIVSEQATQMGRYAEDGGPDR